MKKFLLPALLLATLPACASAGEISNTYLEADYVHVNFSDADIDANGAAARGSVEFGESNVYAFGSYAWLSASIDTFIGEIDVDGSTAAIGVGYAMPVSDRADVLFEGAYTNSDIDSESISGYRLSAGVRGQFAGNVEGWIRANYADTTEDGYDSDGAFSVTPGLQLMFNPTWGVVGEVDIGDDGQTYLLGLRASF